MGLFHTSKRNIRIKITSADITSALKFLADRGYILYDIQYSDNLTAYVTIHKSDRKIIEEILKSRGNTCVVTDKSSLRGTSFFLKRRFVLIVAVAFLCFLTAYIPSKILFIQVKGNQKISAFYITEKAVEHGISFGCSRWEIRSDKLKNQMLEDVPELDWVGITTSGCVATIEVKEKDIPETANTPAYGSIVASVDGIVESVSATKGTALCVPGQAVQAGQLLISGYVDHGFIIKATGAEGEVFGKTYRKLQAIAPTTDWVRGEPTDREVKYALQFGKKVINFSKHSSISPASCGKMYSRSYLTLPGGYILPIALVREEIIYYETADVPTEETDFSGLEASAKEYLLEQMLGGEILECSFAYQEDGDVPFLAAAFICREQIGKYRFEENALSYGENG